MSANPRISIRQGSIIALTNQAGQIVERITYDGHFGDVMEHTQHEVTHNPYGYTGREMDTLRLYYYRARYYSPILHRFLSPDPIEHASGDWNWYRYVGNDPVNRTDPSGLDFVDNTITALKIKKGVSHASGAIKIIENTKKSLTKAESIRNRMKILKRWLDCHDLGDQNYLKNFKDYMDLSKHGSYELPRDFMKGVLQ